jgi:hypothetical protein
MPMPIIDGMDRRSDIAGMIRFMRFTFVSRRGLPALLLFLALFASGCARMYGFAGGGTPLDVKTVAVLPFDNETMRKAMSTRLGLREASEDKANAVVRGKITRFEPDVPVAFSSNPQLATTVRRRLQVVIEVEIFDTVHNRVLWTGKGMSGTGEYAENSETEGRKQAVDKIVSDIIVGVQSQW